MIYVLGASSIHHALYPKKCDDPELLQLVENYENTLCEPCLILNSQSKDQNITLQIQLLDLGLRDSITRHHEKQYHRPSKWPSPKTCANWNAGRNSSSAAKNRCCILSAWRWEKNSQRPWRPENSCCRNNLRSYYSQETKAQDPRTLSKTAPTLRPWTPFFGYNRQQQLQPLSPLIEKTKTKALEETQKINA